MENLQRVIISILIVGVITVFGLLALRPITVLAQFSRNQPDRRTAALFGLVTGLSVPPILFLLALRLSADFAAWAVAGPGPLGWLESEPAFLGATLLFICGPLVFLTILARRASRS